MPAAGPDTGRRRVGLESGRIRLRALWSTAGVPIHLRHGTVEPYCLVRDAERKGHRDIRADQPEVAGGHRDPGLASAIDVVEARRLGSRSHGDTEVDVPQIAGWASKLEPLA